MEARDLRVSDAEREHVGQLLQRAVGQGMLSLGEFTERMDTALASKTRGELNSVLVDLPGMHLAEEHGPAPKPFAAPTPQQPPRRVVQEHWGHGGGASDTLRGTMSTITRKGPWNVPPSLRVSTRMSTVTLDFTQAVMSTQVVEVHVDDYCSTVTLIVPTEATVDLNGVDTVAGSATNKVRTGPPYGPLHLVVSGKVRLGSVTAKHPFGSSIRRMFG
ncbi:hypothetical protein CH254_10590 [Rhodococcus sp. 06-412-2C]|uniref:DUF1707 SHOCT-like domain-containing protein n=1 Tax=unclassified Rhodococcus (in: high G+C Gram-positive bacteria) TaxID=192944 RepID=UPI000B9C5459|nr:MULTISPECIES: DUF1707 domain-containing protein [unclassified Rhodococcus (in: high G+C Gram-positive bacteria)]OZC89043.1 hypothetical protein CH254_10590 [Rhodococcus sp. 06-412-2C]OZC99773.1 hypothetical protein CH279_08245 [Rhodococcus sp. 06-412-2B]